MSESTIIYTYTDEAPALATASFLPLLQAVARQAGVAIETRDMTPAPDGQDYQLWFSHPDGTVTDAGVMPRDEDAEMVLDDDLGDAVGVAVTLEPEGGSTQPTSEPMLVIPFEA